MKRIERFGTKRSYAAGEYLYKAGKVAPGMFVILSGDAAATQHNAVGEEEPIVTHKRGSFSAELALLSSTPALVNVVAQTPVEALVIPPDRLRALMVEEAELGERIMRALILRRVGLLETGHSGPVIVGPSENSDVLRLAGFLSRNGYPHQVLDATTDDDAKALLNQFDGSANDLPLVFCPAGQTLRNPSENELAQCLGMVKPIDPSKVYDVVIAGAGPAGLAAAVYAASEGLEVMVLDCRAFGGQAGASARIENYFGFPTGISGLALTARAYNQAQKFGAGFSIPDELVQLREEGGAFVVDTADGDHVHARAVVIATGARYRRPQISDLEKFEGSHVHYWASPLEATLCARRGSRAGWCGQFRRSGGGVSVRQGRQGVDADARKAAGRLDVAIPRRTHRGAGEHRGIG